MRFAIFKKRPKFGESGPGHILVNVAAVVAVMDGEHDGCGIYMDGIEKPFGVQESAMEVFGALTGPGRTDDDE